MNENDFPKAEDSMQRLWVPHRMVYIHGEKKITSLEKKDCPFCLKYKDATYHKQYDEGHLIVARGEHCFVILNLFPYNGGHAMVCPYRHVSDYTNLSDVETAEFTDFTKKLIKLIEHVSKPEGFNIGMNQGRVAGAGISAHLHQHIIPRWLGDSNFFPIIGQTKPISEFLAVTLEKYSTKWKERYE
jgi:ATP adenylyltransferase